MCEGFWYQYTNCKKPRIKRKLSMRFKSIFKNKSISETSKARSSLAKFCVGDGIDIGFGGDPIVKTAICIDLPERYARYKEHPQHIHGDAKRLKWFSDNSLDYVYSSHVLEDFKDTDSVLTEWLRVLRPGGKLILYLPDEQTYRAYCRSQGKPPNDHHIHDNFSISYLKNFLKNSQNVKIVHENFPCGIYSFELVIEKIL